MLRRLAWIVLLVLLLGAAGWWWRSQADAVRFRTAELSRGAVEASVAATGSVGPVSQVSVGTQVSGQIRDLFVDFNDRVRAGQLLAQIDPATFEHRVRAAQADVDAATAALALAQAQAEVAQAQQARAQAEAEEAQRDAARKRALVERQFVAPDQAERAAAVATMADQAWRASRAQAQAAQAQVALARASLAQRSAVLDQARTDLARTHIVAPAAGVVIKRSVERGQTVAASLQAPELFVIAQDLADMQVEAAIDESDVGRVAEGQTVRFTVDAFAERSFEGRVRQVRKSGASQSNVVTYIVIIGFANTGGQLLPGMTANVRILTETRADVLRAPNAALRARLSDAVLEASGVAVLAEGARLFVPQGTGVRAVPVRTGISDGTWTEIEAGDGGELTAGTVVVLGQVVRGGRAQAGAPPRRSPF